MQKAGVIKKQGYLVGYIKQAQAGTLAAYLGLPLVGAVAGGLTGRGLVDGEEQDEATKRRATIAGALTGAGGGTLLAISIAKAIEQGHAPDWLRRTWGGVAGTAMGGGIGVGGSYLSGLAKAPLWEKFWSGQLPGSKAIAGLAEGAPWAQRLGRGIEKIPGRLRTAPSLALMLWLGLSGARD